MARLSVTNDDDFMRQIARLSDAESLQKKMLKAAANPLVAAMKKRLEAHRHTGALVDAIGSGKPTRARKSKKMYIWIGPKTGYDPKTGVPHMRKMMSLEYGTMHQRATPFLDAAVRDAQEGSVSAMKYVIHQEVPK